VAEQLGNEKLTTLTNLNFDSFPIETFNGFLVSPLLPPSLATRSGFSGCKIPAANYLVVSLRDLLCPTLLTLLNAQRFLKFAALMASGLEGR
jgi:hypothetical protein